MGTKGTCRWVFIAGALQNAPTKGSKHHPVPNFRIAFIGLQSETCAWPKSKVLPYEIQKKNNLPLLHLIRRFTWNTTSKKQTDLEKKLEHVGNIWARPSAGTGRYGYLQSSGLMCCSWEPGSLLTPSKQHLPSIFFSGIAKCLPYSFLLKSELLLSKQEGEAARAMQRPQADADYQTIRYAWPWSWLLIISLFTLLLDGQKWFLTEPSLGGYFLYEPYSLQPIMEQLDLCIFYFFLL